MQNNKQTREEIIEQRVIDFQHSFTGLHGKRTCDYLSKFCLEKQSTYVADSDKSIFNAGAREVILEIRRWIEYDLTKLNKEQDNVREDRTG